MPGNGRERGALRAAAAARRCRTASSAGAFDQTSSPVSIFTARMPPGVCESVPLTPKYASLSSTAPPHCPPRPLPSLVRYCQTIAPFLSGSNAYAMPDFDWMMQDVLAVRFLGEHRRRGEVVIGSLLRPGSAGCRGSSAWQPIIQTSCDTGLRDPLDRARVEIHRDDGVGRRLLRIRVAVAGRRRRARGAARRSSAPTRCRRRPVPTPARLPS